MIGDIDQKQIAAELAAISDRSREALIKDWRLAHKQSPPKGISRRLLEYSAAYQLQVKAFGGLKPTVRRKLRQGMGQTNRSDQANNTSKNPHGLTSGTRLLREWHGRTYTVEVVDSGFLYDGRIHKSLSEIAQAITGTRWSGPRFFGL